MNRRTLFVNLARVAVMTFAASTAGGACHGGCDACDGLHGCSCDRAVPCGAETQPCCADDGGGSGCDSDLVCHSGSCRAPGDLCGAFDEPCCESATRACFSGLACAGGRCRACGAVGNGCCTEDAGCVAGARCNGEGLCQRCGGEGEPCCEGVCNDGRACTRGRCLACGGTDQPCCSGTSRCAYSHVCVEAVDAPRCRHCGDDDEPCCTGVRPCVSTESVCASDNRCRSTAVVCGVAGGPCCARGACGESRVCVDPEVLARLDASDGGDATADDAGDVSDVSDVSEVRDAGDAGDDAAAVTVGLCAPCGEVDELCCVGSRCADPRSTCVVDRDVARCRACGGAGEPCCETAPVCNASARCIVRSDGVARCESTRDGG